MGVTATAFGLDLCSAMPLSFLEGSSAKPTGRTLAISELSADVTSLEWPESAELVWDERHPDDGSRIYRIERDPTDGYLIEGPEYGAYLLSTDGRHLHGARGDCSQAAWQRLLIAQVLPFAALLRGLEVFHASAVVWQGEAVAFLGPSGAGKTSLALALCQEDASFLADDVLALESRDDDLLAHPGTPVAGVAHTEAKRSCEVHGVWLEDVVAVNTRERVVRMVGADAPTRLRALFFLDRRADGPEEPRFESTVDVQLLLAATFNFVLATPARLRGLLDVCALAARLHVERIVVGPVTTASELSVAVRQRLSSLK
jgi:hypothetical protein